MQQEAYDLDAFANRPKSTYEPIRVAQGGNKKNRQRLQKLRTLQYVLTGCLLLGLACALLQSYATLNELNIQVQRTQQDLVSEQSEYDYLVSELSSKTNLKTVEEAAAELGLMKRDESQVTYITLETQSLISSPQSKTEKLLNFLQCMGNDILQALDP